MLSYIGHKKNETLRSQLICIKAFKECSVGVIQFLQCCINKNSTNKRQSCLRGMEKRNHINDSFLGGKKIEVPHIQKDQVKNPLYKFWGFFLFFFFFKELGYHYCSNCVEIWRQFLL